MLTCFDMVQTVLLLHSENCSISPMNSNRRTSSTVIETPRTIDAHGVERLAGKELQIIEDLDATFCQKVSEHT